MRWSKGFTSLLAGTGLCVTGAQVLVGCGKDYEGCEATRTCQAPVDAGGAGGDERSSSDAKPEPAKGGTGGSASARGGAGGSSGAHAGTIGRDPAEGGAAGEQDRPASQGGKRGGSVATDAGAGGAESEPAGGNGGEAASAPVKEDERPHILSTSPANGEQGVRSDAEIRVKFSERMDNASVEAAFHSENLPPVKLLWDEDGTELVIQPSEPLVYADGNDPAATAKFYSFTIAGTAQDATGHAMGDERTFVFTTVRHLAHSLTIPARWARKLYRPADGSADAQGVGCPSADALLYAGDGDEDQGLAFVIAFDVGALPRGVLEWGKATLHASDLGTSAANPYSRFGALEGYAISTPLTDVLWDVPTTGELGPVVTYASLDHFDGDVLDFVPAAYDANLPLEFLFRFETATDGDGHDAYAVVRCKDISLELEYWAP